MHQIRPSHSLALLVSICSSLAMGYLSCTPTTGKAYEISFRIDLPNYLQSLATNKDHSFEELLRQTVRDLRPEQDFWTALRGKFRANGFSIHRYFDAGVLSEKGFFEELGKHFELRVFNAIEILKKRLALYGLRRFVVNQRSDHAIVIEISGGDDIERVRKLLEKTGMLEWQLVTEPELFNDFLEQIDHLQEHGSAGVTSDTRDAHEMSVDDIFAGDRTDRTFFGYLRTIGNDFAVPLENYDQADSMLNSPQVQKIIPFGTEVVWADKSTRLAEKDYRSLYLLKKESLLEGARVVFVNTLYQNNSWTINLELDAEGTRLLSQITHRNIGKRLALVFDNRVLFAPIIQEKIPNGRVVIGAALDRQEAQDLVILLQSGPLPLQIKFLSVREIEA